MADYNIGPNGLQFGGTPICSNNLLLGDANNPGSVLKERLTEQYFRGITRTKFASNVMDDLMPMRASTSQRTSNVDEYRVAVGFDGISNSGGLISAAQSTGGFDLERQFLNQCGRFVTKAMPARGNLNAEGCNPVIDGPMPYVGMEGVSREPFYLRAPILPLCTQDYVNKDPGVWAKTLDAIIQTTIDANIYRWQLGKMRWAISKSRWLASPIQENKGNGNGAVPISPALFSKFGFGRVPTHYGSPDWFSGMIRETEMPIDKDITVELPVAILVKYKKQYLKSIGYNNFGSPTEASSQLNGYFRTIQDENLIYRDLATGRKITFKGTTRPTFVEVTETGTATGEWAFQEKEITRDSENAGLVMPRPNPLWGRKACDGKTLAAIVAVYADDTPPFYTEPMPNNNPDAAVAGVIAKYGGGKVNSTLLDLYPSSLEIRLLTGLDAQVHLIAPLNRRYRDAGWTCDKFSNLEDTYVGGYVKIGGVFVENEPRNFAFFMLKMPLENTECVEYLVEPADAPVIPAEIDLDPVNRMEARKAFVPPAPPTPAAAPAGTIRAVGRSKNVKAPCTGTKVIELAFERVGGTAGSLTLAIAGTATTHITGLPTSVVFADGESYKVVTATAQAWACPSDVPATESVTLTFGPTNLTSGAYSTKKICITCNSACTTNDCPAIEGDCKTCV